MQLLVLACANRMPLTTITHPALDVTLAMPTSHSLVEQLIPGFAQMSVDEKLTGGQVRHDVSAVQQRRGRVTTQTNTPDLGAAMPGTKPTTKAPRQEGSKGTKPTTKAPRQEGSKGEDFDLSTST